MVNAEWKCISNIFTQTQMSIDHSACICSLREGYVFSHVCSQGDPHMTT